MHQKISIVIVNYKTAKLACDAVKAVLQDNVEYVQIILVDNDSQDGSTEIIQELASQFKQVIFLPQLINGGFAYGSNAGIRKALEDNSDYVMLLNPDTEIKPNAINALADFLDKNPDVGIVGSQLENLQGKIESSAHNFHSPLSELVESARLGFLSRLFPNAEITPPRKNFPHQCDWVSGASMMVRKEVFDDIGLLDERYFLYFEEVDFFFRAKEAGWQTWYVPDSKVMHIEGAATGIKSKKRRPSYWYESRRRFFVKHYGVSGLIFADVLWAVGRVSYLFRRFIKLGAQKENNDPKWMAYDLLTGDLIAVLSTRAWRLRKQKVD